MTATPSSHRSSPAPQAAEPFGLDGACRIVQGDCLEILASLGEGTVDLVYLDPPFNTGRRRSATGGGAPVSFADAWATPTEHVAFLRPRIEQCRRVLRPTGSILLHCDWRSCHHLRLLLDEVFGPEQFVNHLVWAYGLGGSSGRGFARKHDDILFYGRTQNHWFEPPRVPATSARLRGRTKKATDVLHIPSINNMAAERTGYPTQKPLALLRLLVAACCPPGGLLVDPFCGSGTALVAALECGRRAFGVDLEGRAVALAQRRVRSALRGAAVECAGCAEAASPPPGA